MQNRWVISGVVAVLLLPPALIGGFFAKAWMNGNARDREAERAFAPIEKLGLVVFSNPVFSYRYCSYYVEFRETTQLDDKTISQLSAMNTLSDENEVMLTIQTRNVTDASLSSLKTLSTLDYLDVTDTAISDAGLKALRSALPDCRVEVRNESDQAMEEELR